MATISLLPRKYPKHRQFHSCQRCIQLWRKGSQNLAITIACRSIHPDAYVMVENYILVNACFDCWCKNTETSHNFLSGPFLPPSTLQWWEWNFNLRADQSEAFCRKTEEQGNERVPTISPRWTSSLEAKPEPQLPGGKISGSRHLRSIGDDQLTIGDDQLTCQQDCRQACWRLHSWPKFQSQDPKYLSFVCPLNWGGLQPWKPIIWINMAFWPLTNIRSI